MLIVCGLSFCICVCYYIITYTLYVIFLQITLRCNPGVLRALIVLYAFVDLFTILVVIRYYGKVCVTVVTQPCFNIVTYRCNYIA